VQNNAHACIILQKCSKTMQRTQYFNVHKIVLETKQRLNFSVTEDAESKKNEKSEKSDLVRFSTLKKHPGKALTAQRQ